LGFHKDLDKISGEEKSTPVWNSCAPGPVIYGECDCEYFTSTLLPDAVSQAIPPQSAPLRRG